MLFLGLNSVLFIGSCHLCYRSAYQHCSGFHIRTFLIFSQTLLEKHKEFSEKLEEMCDNLTLTENRLIGHQQQAGNTESVSDLQQYQQEHQVGQTLIYLS